MSTYLLFPLCLCGFVVTQTTSVLHVLASSVLIQIIQTPTVLYVLQISASASFWCFLLYGCAGWMLGILGAFDVLVTAVLFVLSGHIWSCCSLQNRPPAVQGSPHNGQPPPCMNPALMNAPWVREGRRGVVFCFFFLHLISPCRYTVFTDIM